MKKIKHLILFAFMSVMSIGTVSAQCTASFTYTDNGNGNYTFTNTSTGSNWSSWYFGNGGSSSSNSTVSNTYLTNGTYNVFLTVGDSNNACTDTAYQLVTVTSVAPCNVTAGFTYVDNGNGNYTFTNTSTGSNWSYFDFGNGVGSSSSSTVSTTYLTNGTYNVSLQAVDSLCTDTIIQTIIVTSVPPCNVTAGFTYADNGNGNYTFTNTSTGSNWSSWYFGNGGNSSSNSTVSNTYLTNGTYNVFLTVGDSNNACTDTAYQLVTVTSVAPCNITTGYTYTDNGSGSISFSSIITGGVAPYTYAWWFDGVGSTVANPTQTFINGQYNPTLTVTDANGCIAWFGDTVTVTSATPCNVSAGISYTDNGNGNYSFNSTSTGNVNYDVWNYGDGSSDTGGNVSHTFAANGTFVVSLYVSDSLAGAGCDDYAYVTIVVTGVSNPAPCQAGYSVYLDSMTNIVNVVNSSTGTNLSYFWEFGDGNYSTLQYPSYTYTSAGPFLLCLTVTDSLSGGMCSSTYCDSIGSNGIVLKGGSGFTINVRDPATVGVAEIDQVTSFNVFPNPIKNNVNIEFNLVKSSNVEVFVTDLLGNRVALIVSGNMNSGNNKISYNVSDISNGIYLLSINTDNSLHVKKIVVNK